MRLCCICVCASERARARERGGEEGARGQRVCRGNVINQLQLEKCSRELKKPDDSCMCMWEKERKERGAAGQMGNRLGLPFKVLAQAPTIQRHAWGPIWSWSDPRDVAVWGRRREGGGMQRGRCRWCGATGNLAPHQHQGSMHFRPQRHRGWGQGRLAHILKAYDTHFNKAKERFVCVPGYLNANMNTCFTSLWACFSQARKKPDGCSSLGPASLK